MLGVVGFDFGGQYSLVAAARKGGIDVLANEASQRRTPTLVGFGEQKRTVGDAAAVQQMRNVANTVASVKQLLGRSWTDAELQAEVQSAQFKVQPSDDDASVAVSVRLCGESVRLSPTQIAAMMLAKLRAIAVAELQCPVRDVVIGVPVFWGDAPRRAMLAAAELAGLNCLRLLNETTAAALAWGIFRPLADGESHSVVFYDLGHTALQVALVQFSAGKLRVLATAANARFGGRSVDRALFEWAATQIQAKYRLDVRSNARASLRLLAACEKLKVLLNSNPVGVLAVENLMNDVDVSMQVPREVLDETLAPLTDAFLEPVDAVLRRAGLSAAQLTAIEAVGGASRLRFVNQALLERFGREFSRTLNSEEAVARGCALMCAKLSPALRVREYKVEECVNVPLQLRWDGADPLEAFPVSAAVPAHKLVTFPRAKPLHLYAEVAASASFPEGASREVAQLIIPPSALPPSSHTDEKLLVRLSMDENMILSLDSVKLESLKMASSSSSSAENDVEKEKKMEGEETSPTKEESKEGESSPLKKVKETQTITGAVQWTIAHGVSKTQLEAWKQAERTMAERDAEVEATEKAHNDLEAYILRSRHELDGRWRPFCPDDVCTQLRKLADEYEAWLYDFAEEAARAEFSKRLDQLRSLGDPVERRWREADERPSALAAFEARIAEARALAESQDAAYDHIGREDREKILAKVRTAEDYIRPKLEAQAALSPAQDPAVLAADLYSYSQNVLDFARPIMSKPKPKPKPEPESKPAPENESKEDVQKEADSSDPPNDMDVEPQPSS